MDLARLIIILAGSRLGACQSLGSENVVGFLSSESFVRVVGYEGAYNLHVGLKVRARWRFTYFTPDRYSGADLARGWIACLPQIQLQWTSQAPSVWRHTEVYTHFMRSGFFISPDTDSQSIYFPSHFHYRVIFMGSQLL